MNEDERILNTLNQKRRAQFAFSISKYIAGAVTALVVMLVVMWVFFQQYTQLRAFSGLSILPLVWAGLYPVLRRRGQTRLGFNVLVITLLFTVVLVPLLVTEALPSIAIGYMVTIITGTLLLGNKGGRWVIGACILGFTADIILINLWAASWSAPLDEPFGLAVSVSVSAIALLAGALIIRSIIIEQQKAYQQAQQANLEIEKRAATEQEQREYLQNTLRKYVDYMDEVAQGNLSARLTFDEYEQRASDDPLIRLGLNMNETTASLERTVNRVQEQREYLQTTVQKYVEYMNEVAQGNLSIRLSLNTNGWEVDDAMTVLGRNLNAMVERLGEMTSQIQEATVSINSAATEILTATSQQASSANEQSAAISQTSTTIDEVKTIVEQNFGKAQAVAEQAQQTRNISRNGQQAVTNTVESMSQIKEKVESIAENILALSEQTQQIGEITATVNGIASQSNLLALNASVEAARAGEHGKGFAVVAVEVRNLAEQSKQATAQVKAILNEIQRATNAAVMATEEGTKGVDAGVQLTGQTGETIEQLAASIAESAGAAQQIVASAQQQSTGMEQIALAMDNINQATLQNLASTRQAEKSAQDLSNVAKQLEAVVARYKLN